MRITAEDLDGWAEKPEARSEFPALIRRLLAHSAARALLAAGRPVAALNVLGWCPDPPPGAPWLEILEKLAETGPESTSDKTLVSIFVDQAIKRLEADPSVDRNRLAWVELKLLDYLWQIRDSIMSLWTRLTSDPAFLVELLKLAFRAEGEPPRKLEEHNRAGAGSSYRLLVFELRHCPRIPGQLPDGTVDAATLERFVEEARERARAAGRLTICEQTLGQMLAGAPGEADGRWPCEPVAALLDRPELGEVRKGFAIGVLNAHATRLRPLVEMASWERRLAEDYRRHARAWSARYPRTAACLSDLAHRKEHHAQSDEEMYREWVERMM